MKINKEEAVILCREQFADTMSRTTFFDNCDLPPASDFKAALDAEIPIDEWETTAWELLDDIDGCCEAVLEMVGWHDDEDDEE